MQFLSCLLRFVFCPLPANRNVCVGCVFKIPCHSVEHVGRARFDMCSHTHLVDDIAFCRTVRTFISYRMAFRDVPSSRRLNPLRNLPRNQLQSPPRNLLPATLMAPLSIRCINHLGNLSSFQGMLCAPLSACRSALTTLTKPGMLGCIMLPIIYASVAQTSEILGMRHLAFRWVSLCKTSWGKHMDCNGSPT